MKKVIDIPKEKRKPIKVASKAKPFPVVAIGASAGGLEAITELLKYLPANTGMAFIYVQHLSPDHKSLLTSILSKITKMKVQEIENMEHMAPNNVYVIPHNKGIAVTDGHIQLIPRTTNLSIDVLFSSLAVTHKANVIGIVLSGNANDGTKGIKDIKKAGGLTFAQDDSAQANSMPHSAIATGEIDFILSPRKIAAELVILSKNGLKIRNSKSTPENSNKNNIDLNSVFELLLKETGVDFSHYKMPTIKRRLNHKMQQSGIRSLEDYMKTLRKDKKELTALYKDLLINVTDFFRDKEAFRYLKSSVLPKLLKLKSEEETLRIWVAACLTGEEAYSIAMMLAEMQTNKKTKIPVQIFATDLSEEAIREARVGDYSSAKVKDIPKKYLERFFEKVGDQYRVTKELREICVFAPHNILRDPPFSRMDFISCRNLLIYFDTAAQKKVFATLNFALNEGGILMLGKAETIGTSTPLFSHVNSKLKFYSKKKNSGTTKLLELTPRFPRTNHSTQKPIIATKSNLTIPIGIESTIDSILLASYIPACVVINKDMEILQFRGPISIFLTHPSGKASLNILKMTRPEFAFELRNAIQKALKSKQSVTKSGIELKLESEIRLMSFEVRPLKIDWDEPLLLIVFSLKEHQENYIEQEKNGNNNSAIKDRRIKKLVEELTTTRTEMNAVIDAQEKTYEELQAANEEIVSSNEEFQTLNEELETSKEEIEATNEELISTNQELQNRNELLTEAQEYSDAIIATIHEPMLVLYKDFRVKSANKSFYEKFKVKKEETEGKSLFDLGNKQWNIPKLHEVLNEIISTNEGFENLEVTHTFPGIGEKIVLLNASLIIQKINSEKLILLAIEDITERTQFIIKENKQRKKAEDKFRGLLESAPDAIVIVNSSGKIQLVNTQTEKLFGYNRDEIIGREVEMLIPAKYHLLHDSHRNDYSIDPKPRSMGPGAELYGLRKNGEEFPVEISLSKLATEEGFLVSAAIRDITHQKKIADELQLAKGLAEEAQIKAENAQLIAEDAVKAKQQFLANMSHEIRTPMNAIIGFTKVVMKTELTSKQKEYLSAIKVSGDTLIALINDILDLAKVDARKMVFEKSPFQMKTTVASMLHIFEMKIMEKNLQLIQKYDDRIPDTLIGDPIRLHQIVMNLMSNAIKFTQEGTITVNVKLLNEDAVYATIEISVSDTGIGIEENSLSKIFENFQQANTDTSRLFGGTGLGLAIVKQLVESQGGRVTVSSKVNKGTTFAFVLTFLKTDIQIEPAQELIELDKSVKGIKILVVEDIALNQLLMKTLLDDFGFESEFAANGQLAIDKIKSTPFDIVLMDLQMPVMNGFEATEHIRQVLKMDVPIIALTADVTAVDVKKSFEIGMNDYIAKPVDEKELYRKLVGYVKHSSALIQLSSSEHTTITEVQIANESTCIDLAHLRHITRSNTTSMTEMITIFLQQTPELVEQLTTSLKEKNWDSMKRTAHKMVPSIGIMGIDKSYENKANRIQEIAGEVGHLMEVEESVKSLSNILSKACKDLKEELKYLNGKKGN